MLQSEMLRFEDSIFVCLALPLCLVLDVSASNFQSSMDFLGISYSIMHQRKRTVRFRIFSRISHQRSKILSRERMLVRRNIAVLFSDRGRQNVATLTFLTRKFFYYIIARPFFLYTYLPMSNSRIQCANESMVLSVVKANYAVEGHNCSVSCIIFLRVVVCRTNRISLKQRDLCIIAANLTFAGTQD